jgi:signal transduction histidine kinase
VNEQPLGMGDVMRILEESSQLIRYSRRLQEKSRQLEAATRELRSANESLRQLDRMKDDFVSTVSHELRTPLTSIRSFAEILHDTPDLEEAERREFLEIIISESERLTRLINDMLDLAKIEAGQMTWHMGEVDLASVINAAVAATGQLFRDKGIELSLVIAEDVPPITGDADRLTQVVINLLSNAVKFTPGGSGRVRVTLARSGERWIVRVSDNGSGIAPEDQQAVFERFRQGGDAMTAKPEGTGLGLPICRMIVGHHGGTIEVDSAPGSGATFTVALPIALREESAAAPPSAATQPA